jgi:hypothetical protein
MAQEKGSPMNHHANTLKALRENQKLQVGGPLSKPFLEEPAAFTDQRARPSAKASGECIKIPPPDRDPVMNLAEVIGAAAVNDIVQQEQLVFHSVGDTGNHDNQSELAQVVQAMLYDLHRLHPADQPSFFLHLGDVCYDGPGQYVPTTSKEPMYGPQFYRPYDSYPRKILALAGNHESNPQEAFDGMDQYKKNFCAAPPAEVPDENAPRGPMYQPGAYFTLVAPFVDIICLFSNGMEAGFGAICSNENVPTSGVIGNVQYDFLVNQLQAIVTSRAAGKRKALIVAVHHPPYSGGGNAGSGFMLDDLDRAFAAGGVGPDAVISGHSHNYQRFHRVDSAGGEVPYIVAGNGGHAPIGMLKLSRDRTPVRLPLRGARPGHPDDNHALYQYFNGFGHLFIVVTKDTLRIDFMGAYVQSRDPVDSVTVDLNRREIIAQTEPFEHPAPGEEGNRQ